MCYCWYTIQIRIRTWEARIGEIGEGTQWEALVDAGVVIGDDIQMIIENIDGIYKGIDHAAAESEVLPVTVGKTAEKEDHAITVHHLGL